MIINKVELPDIDLEDLETVEKFEKAINDMQVAEEKIKTSTKLSDVIKSNCIAIFDFFNTLFGEGTDKKIFGDKTNLRICMDAYDELMSQLEKKKSNILKSINKYSNARARR